MKLEARPSFRGAERCPYCHDALEAFPDALVECTGCGTRHHLLCLEELGRCTVHGCERPIEHDPELHSVEVAGRSSAAVLALRRRIRDRMRTYAQHRADAAPSERAPDGTRLGSVHYEREPILLGFHERLIRDPELALGCLIGMALGCVALGVLASMVP